MRVIAGATTEKNSVNRPPRSNATYQRMCCRLIPVASRAASNVLRSEDDPAKWSHLFHTAMDLLCYEEVRARPLWVCRAVEEKGKTLGQLWKRAGMLAPE